MEYALLTLQIGQIGMEYSVPNIVLVGLIACSLPFVENVTRSGEE